MSWATLRPAARLNAPSRGKIVDAGGAAVSIPRDGRGVVMGGPMLGEYMLATSDPASLLSFTKFGNAPLNSSVMGRIFPELRAKDTELAQSLNLERLMLANPSAVLPWGPAPDALVATQLPVVNINSLAAPEWWFGNVRIYGDLVGQPRRGAEMRSHFYEVMGKLQADLSAISSAAPVTVLELSPAADGALKDTAVQGLQNRWLNLAGAWNAEQSAPRQRIDMERLYRLDPQVIVLGRVAAITPLQCMNNPLWRPLRAVQNRRIYKRPPGMVFTTTGIVEYPIYTRWLAELLYPDQMVSGLRESMRKAYDREIHYSMTDRDLDELLAVKENRFSAHYDRFEARHERKK